MDNVVNKRLMYTVTKYNAHLFPFIDLLEGEDGNKYYVNKDKTHLANRNIDEAVKFIFMQLDEDIRRRIYYVESTRCTAISDDYKAVFIVEHKHRSTGEVESTMLTLFFYMTMREAQRNAGARWITSDSIIIARMREMVGLPNSIELERTVSITKDKPLTIEQIEKWTWWEYITKYFHIEVDLLKENE